MNTIFLIGNLGRDPEMRQLSQDNMMAKFSLAVTGRRKGESVTMWFDCTAFGRTAESIGSYLTKGRKIAVRGRVDINVVERDGVKRTYWNVLVDEFAFCDKSSGSNPSETKYARSDGAPAGDEIGDANEEEIPF